MNSTSLFTLQLFADAGTVMNGTNGYTNAYTGAVTEFGGNNTMDPTLKTFYDTELLENARTETFYAQFAKKQPLPANNGETVEWRKWNTFARAERLQEGVIPTGQMFGQTKIQASIGQYGTYTTVTDRLEMHAYDDVILGATEEMGGSLSETQEDLIRAGLLTGTNVLYCDNVNTESSNAFVSTPTSQQGMRSAAAAYSLLTADMVNRAATTMKKNKAPKLNGKYYAVIHPSVAYDLRQDEGWIEAHKYGAPEQLFNGEIGELHGVRFIENTFAPVLVGADLCAATRYLTTTNAITVNNSGVGSVLGDAGDAGEKTGYQVTVSDTCAADIVGRKIQVTAATAEGTAPRGVVEVKGFDSSAKTLYLDGTVTGTTSGDFLVPGEGGQEYKGGAQNAVYATFFFGKDAFGIIDPAEGGAEMIVKPKGQIGGPLEQFSTIGYKFETNGATILYNERILRVMSCSYYSETDDAN